MTAPELALADGEDDVGGSDDPVAGELVELVAESLGAGSVETTELMVLEVGAGADDAGDWPPPDLDDVHAAPITINAPHARRVTVRFMPDSYPLPSCG